jgi:hypothetical protein
MYKNSANDSDVNNAGAAARKSSACAAATSSAAADAATAVAWKPGCRVARVPQDLSENYCKSQCTKSDINIFSILIIILLFY